MTLMLSCSRSVKFLFFCLSAKPLGEADSSFCLILPLRENSPSSCVVPAPFCDVGTADPLADISERKTGEPRYCGEIRALFEGGGLTAPSLSLSEEASLQICWKRGDNMAT